MEIEEFSILESKITDLLNELRVTREKRSYLEKQNTALMQENAALKESTDEIKRSLRAEAEKLRLRLEEETAKIRKEMEDENTKILSEMEEDSTQIKSVLNAKIDALTEENRMLKERMNSSKEKTLLIKERVGQIVNRISSLDLDATSKDALTSVYEDKIEEKEESLEVVEEESVVIKPRIEEVSANGQSEETDSYEGVQEDDAYELSDYSVELAEKEDEEEYASDEDSLEEEEVLSESDDEDDEESFAQEEESVIQDNKTEITSATDVIPVDDEDPFSDASYESDWDTVEKEPATSSEESSEEVVSEEEDEYTFDGDANTFFFEDEEEHKA